MALHVVYTIILQPKHNKIKIQTSEKIVLPLEKFQKKEEKKNTHKFAITSYRKNVFVPNRQIDKIQMTNGIHIFHIEIINYLYVFNGSYFIPDELVIPFPFIGNF